MLKYKIDVLSELKKAGYNATRIREENILSQGTITNIHRNIIVRPVVLDRLCALLNLQPADIIEYVPDKEL